MPLPFRRRIFLVLVAMAAVPTGLAVIGWMLTVRTVAPASGARASLEEVAGSARVMLDQIDTNRLAPAARAAMRAHIEALSRGVSLARRADLYLRYYTAGLAIVVVALGTLVLFAAVRVAGHLSRQLSRPIDELVGWTRLIRQREALPGGPPTRGAPEFESLRLALRDLAGALDAARARELEAERLRAFREVARRVAHEIKNPLTSMRIAVEQLGRPGDAADQRRVVALEVLVAETDRLEQLAREFADFGRLPEGPTSEVDLVELLEELGRTAVPEQVAVVVHANGRRSIQGHYDPLRRAFSNLFRNAAEAMGGRGTIDVTVAGEGRGIVVTVADHGPGIPPDLRGRVFQPYMTTKVDGTGLGLALVRQTVDAHSGTIAASETPGGGATFTLVFPA
ncbi:MAG TPA: HAMP domain-containing sensor histidine kinase [Gemmatimonadales bacterium]|jgi:signal transduction histidine kinase|nr:HAMP domain-containing sensor histidine kinase [Gemmatimonadales bacterium]